MQKSRKSIFIISFSTIKSDSRVLRQIQYLSPHFDLTVLGYGEPHPAWQGKDNVKWLKALPIDPDNALKKFTNRALLVSGKLYSESYRHMYWSQPVFKDALAKALASGCDAFHANEWNSLPVAAEAAKRLNARLVYEAHEYSPLEFEGRRTWRILMAPMIEYLLRKYAPEADASITVAPLIAEKYKEEFHIDPIVVMNTPSPLQLPSREIDPEKIRLIYHGCALRERRLEDLISTVAKCDRRYSLHLMMTGYDTGYFDELQKLGRELIPGRLVFHDPVPPEDVAREISQYDMGFCFIPPASYSMLASLPNKLFECIVAGLPVCIGPSPSMVEIVRSYKIGCVSPSFEPDDFADILNQLSTDELIRMRAAVREAAKQINADVELGKVVELYQSLFSEGKQ